MTNAGPLEDRLLIRELYGLYADASCRGDREAWLACFTPDGQWNSHIFQCTGAAELRAEWDKLWADWDEVAFWGEIGWIQVSGDRAIARSYAREIVKLSAGGLFKLFGRYDDELERRDSRWLFTQRNYAPMILAAPEQ
jgi:ketosteroid isomerase-like protein